MMPFIIVHGQDLDQEGVLRVGMEANYAPFNWSQPNADNGALEISNAPGEYANGYDVQIAQKLAEALNLKLEIVKLDWDGLPPALQSGKIDAIIAGMSPTPERREQIDFSASYYDSDIVVVVAKDGKYAQAKSLDDLKGAKLTGQLNTFHYELIDQVPQVDKQVAMESFPVMITSVASGKIDGYLSERPGAMAAVAANPDLTYIAFDQAGTGFDTGQVDTQVAVGLRKDSGLRQAIDEALSKISSQERQDIMDQMVKLNVQDTNQSFWQQVQSVWTKYGELLLRGAGMTLLIAFLSTVFGFLLGLMIAIFRSLPIKREKSPFGFAFYKLLDLLLVIYIEVFRGTPMMVQAMLIFYGSKLFFNWDLSPLFAAIFIVSINTGAYLSEVIRGGITGVDKGQSEAAKAIGMNHFQTMVYIVLPQAIKQILPSLGNEFVINIKDTSVLNVIAVTELFFVTKSAAGSTYLTFQTFLLTAIIYFVLTFTMTRLLRLLEYHLEGSKSYHVHTSSSYPDGKELEIHG